MSWSTVELGTAIICACLPTYGPFVQVAVESLARIRTWSASKQTVLRASRSIGSRQLIPRPWRKHEVSLEELEDAGSANANIIRNKHDDFEGSAKSSAFP